MKIINADVEFITPIDGAAILKRLEQCGLQSMFDI